MPNEMGLTIKIPGKERKNHSEDDKPFINKKTSILSTIFKILSIIKKCFIK